MVCQRFKTPLESASTDLAKVQEEWDDMVSYAKQYLNLVQEDYKVIWWTLFNAVVAKDWSNILAIVELLFCLPLSNGRLERLFSQLKLIKSQKRTCLQEGTLENLLRIHVEGPPGTERAQALQWTCGIVIRHAGSTSQHNACKPPLSLQRRNLCLFHFS